MACAIVAALSIAAVISLLIRINNAPVAPSFPIHLIVAAPAGGDLEGGLEGFGSPYLGHNGSWDGKGGAIWGGSKIADMDRECAMGLRWTFMPVYWRSMEPDGPVNLKGEEPPAWKELDAFVIAAHARRLNILLQAPVIGGNAGGPPAWAGRRENGKSAPLNMEALADFAGKLAKRYCPGGTLAQSQGWGGGYGVRAWELDNEPESYLTHWQGQAADYAEFATRAAERIKAVWVLWPTAGTGDAEVEVPVIHERVSLLRVDGSEIVENATGHRLALELKGDKKMAPPVIVVDRARRDSK